MEVLAKNLTHEKETGRIYTPGYIVSSILDLANYKGNNVLKKHVIDNSCGDGAFLCEIVKRYCETAIASSMKLEEIKSDLQKYIHGIEIEITERDKCLKNMDSVVSKYGILGVKWDVLCGNTLEIHKYDGKMDFVLGNPPYVRVHNLNDSFKSVKKFFFAQGGMTDLFIVFYEIGIRMLSPKGVLGYITPSSFFNSVAGSYMRKVFVYDSLITKIVDLKHFQAFNATTYTTIVILQNGNTNRFVKYYSFDEEKKIPIFEETLTPDDYYINDQYFFSKKSNIKLLKKIFFNIGKCDAMVKNGYATLCDGVFVGNFDFESKYVIPVVKSSRGIRQSIIYPYDEKATLVPEEILKQDKNVYKYLLTKKNILTKRSNEKDAEKYWYAFGRSQALGDTYKNKLAINSLLRNENDFKFVEAPAGVGVYGGLYIISDKIPITEIIMALKSPEFSLYISLLAKYKSGGYYTFSSKDVKAYLDYKFAYDGGLLSC